MDEKKIIEQLDERTKDITVPEKLLPENILNTAKDTKNKKVISFSTSKKIGTFVSVAAVLVLTITLFKGVISNDKSISGSDTATNVMSAGEESGSYVIAKTGNISDYDDVYKVLEKYKAPERSWFDKLFSGGMKSATNEIYYEESMTMAETVAAGAVTDSVAGTGAMNGMNSVDPTEGEGGDYSKTNVQTVGIDEADIIKTDGKYIYYASANLHTVTIYEVDGASTTKVTNLYIEEIGNLSEIYVDGNMLLATGISYRDDKYHIALVKYDITDRANPQYVGQFTQEGTSIETRKIGNVVYIVTEVRSNVNTMKKNEPETFVPSVCGELIDVEEIYIPGEAEGTTYTVISSVDVSGNISKIDSAAVLGFDGTFYMGTESMYLYRTRYASSSSADHVMVINDRYTEIRKIDYVSENGLIGAVTEGQVPGVVKDTFAINEYNGYLRVMTTSYPSYNNNESVNNVFVLNQELSVVGSIEGLAKGERIYSARYMGDTAYFVTYRETDPLYSVDLSDPASPKIMGALKIPGFSEYLHGYGNGKLLGIGIEVVENKNGWNMDYIKLSMFDTTDPYNVTEDDKMILNDANYAIALYNYKTVMIDPEKNIFAFTTENYDTGETFYRVFKYTEAGFVEIIHEKLAYADVYSTRSVYIGDYVYVVNDEGVTAYSLK